jgi:hypothetical protein
VAELQAATGNRQVGLLLADLASQASIRQAAEEYRPRRSFQRKTNDWLSGQSRSSQRIGYPMRFMP